ENCSVLTLLCSFRKPIRNFTRILFLFSQKRCLSYFFPNGDNRKFENHNHANDVRKFQAWTN
ncbi:hypothetical protein PHET_12131, partial [Paragonimus heterotremus]